MLSPLIRLIFPHLYYRVNPETFIKVVLLSLSRPTWVPKIEKPPTPCLLNNISREKKNGIAPLRRKGLEDKFFHEIYYLEDRG